MKTHIVLSRKDLMRQSHACQRFGKVIYDRTCIMDRGLAGNQQAPNRKMPAYAESLFIQGTCQLRRSRHQMIGRRLRQRVS